MASPKDFTKYDNFLSNILVEEGSILGFLSAVFNFLGRRTDFYYVQKDPKDALGFPEGVAEQLVLKVLHSCNPKKWSMSDKPPKYEDINNEIMCSTVAQEVEVVAEGEEINSGDDERKEVEVDSAPAEDSTPAEDSAPAEDKRVIESPDSKDTSNKETMIKVPEDYVPPVIPKQLSSESYNGAIREKYTWSQTITELDITIKLPPDVKSAKDLKVVINSGDISVMKRTGEVMIKDTFPYKIKGSESMWSISEGKLLIHLEKSKERWWTRLLSQEEELDLSKLDCSRPLDELPEDHVAKIRELQWNEERKHQGLPTSDELRKIQILKKAWNAEGSPFKGQEFNPNVLMK